MKYDIIIAAADKFHSNTVGKLKSKLLDLRSKMVQVAQAELDNWTQDDDGIDEELGGGGACDQIAQEIGGVIVANIADVDIIDGGQDGDDHAFIIAYNADEAYVIDIPPDIYESGSGYSWRKLPDVKLDVNDIVIEKIDRKLIDQMA
jgi:hypothetical protein